MSDDTTRQPTRFKPLSDALAEGAPTVTCLVTTYNYASFLPRALDSVLAQDYPLGAVEIVVVDDGSTDETAAALGPYMDRIRYVHKQNGGLVSAVNRGMEEAAGELIALLDADDEWPPAKLSRQVALLEAHPEVGLVHGDMTVIDAGGEVVEPSFLAAYGLKPCRGRVSGKLAARNFVTTAALMVRASLREQWHPIPSWSPWADWWIAGRVAEVSDVDHLTEPVARYRRHGSNAALGTGGDKLVRALGRELDFRRWMLAQADPRLVSADEAIAMLTAFEWTAAKAQAGVVVDGLDRMAAARAFGRARDAETAGDRTAAICALVQALGHVPHEPAAAAELRRLVANGPPTRPPAPPEPVGRVVAAYADELVTSPAVALRAVGELAADTTALLAVVPGESSPDELEAALVAAGADVARILLLAPHPSREAQLARVAQTVVSDRDRPDAVLRRPAMPAGAVPDPAPTVSIVVTAYNLARYLPAALDSALAQDYPAGSLQIVVVDDGSTDDTLAVLTPYLDRVELVSQENRGLIGATNAGLERAHGDYITFLDADDLWQRDRVRRLVDALERNPQAGIAYGDMEMIDADGGLLHGSYLDSHRIERVTGRVYGPLLRQSLVAAGSLMVRGSLRERFVPIAPGAPYQDWWIAAAVAEAAEIVHVRAPVNRYRLHGANDFLAAQSGERLARALREETPFRRRLLRRVLPGQATAADIVAGVAALGTTIAKLAELTGELPVVTPEDQRLAGAAVADAAAALAGGDLDTALALVANAFGHDPGHPAARTALTRFSAATQALDDARSLTAVSFASEAIADPALLRAWAAEFRAEADATLVLYAPDADAEATVSALSAALAASGAEDSDLLLVAEERDPLARGGARGTLQRADHTRRRGPGPAFVATGGRARRAGRAGGRLAPSATRERAR